jgi:hypothetical protein
MYHVESGAIGDARLWNCRSESAGAWRAPTKWWRSTRPAISPREGWTALPLCSISAAAIRLRKCCTRNHRVEPDGGRMATVDRSRRAATLVVGRRADRRSIAEPSLRIARPGLQRGRAFVAAAGRNPPLAIHEHGGALGADAACDS